MATNKNDIKYYLDLPWTYTVRTAVEEGEKFYIVCVSELLGVCTDGATLDEAMKNIREAMSGAFELYLKHGDEIPVPVDEEAYKGNIAYRTSSKRHYLIAKEAERRGVSLSKTIDELVDATMHKH